MYYPQNKLINMLDNDQIIACTTEINNSLKDCRELRNQHTIASIRKTVELLNLIHEDIQKLAFLENSLMLPHSLKIQIDNREYSCIDWFNEIVMPNYDNILSYLEIDCMLNGITLDLDEQTMRISLR